MKIRIDVSDGKNVFFISDFHLFHKNVIKFDNRPFVTKDNAPELPAMHKAIITNWNSVVGKNDVVFYLGDLCFGRPEWADEVIWGLNGKIHYIMGNHDEYNDITNYKRFETVADLVDLKILNSPLGKETHVVLCHYPIYSWNKAHHGSYHVHGHCHGNLHHGEGSDYYVGRKVIDVGCNLIDYTPIAYTKAIEKMEINGQRKRSK